MPYRLQTRLYTKFIQPKSIHPDKQRREFIFNILIGLFWLASCVTLTSSTLNHLFGNAPGNVNSIPVTIGFLTITSGLWWLSRKGHYEFGAYMLSGLVWLASLQLVLTWSFELPMAQLVNVLVIAVVGVVLSSTAASLFTLLVVITTLVIGRLQVDGVLTPNVQWLHGKLEFSDAVGQVVIYIIIGGILWLSNREIDTLLRRAWRSEKALAKERDQLEITVAKRTQELERTQLSRVLELQQFAEFGRVSASLLHDLANPLTAAAINLEEAGSKRGSKLVAQAMVSLGHIERYIKTARKQLQGTGEKHTFNVAKEVTDVADLLKNQLSSARVGLQLNLDPEITVYGDSVAFHRIIANLLVNAIQSFGVKKPTTKREVIVTATRTDNQLVVTVQDNGLGIKPVDLPHIFDDFYSTKKQIGRGLGIGLASAKQVIEHDFNGSITAISSPKSGTIFTLGIPHHEPSNRKKYTARAAVSDTKTNLSR